MRTLLVIFVALVYFIQGHAQGEYGCTDVSAANYNASATQDDGTCRPEFTR
ncbi:MAG: hypothetical protein ACKOZY_09700 [Flavobacteriales bacterium]